MNLTKKELNNTILEPTQENVDTTLIMYIDSLESYKEIYREQKELQYKLDNMINEALEQKDDNWNKLFRAKTHAESHIFNNNKIDADRLHELEIVRKELETDMELYKAVYYHARDKIKENRNTDILTSQAWEMYS